MYEVTHKNNFDLLRVFLAVVVMLAHMSILNKDLLFKNSMTVFYLISEVAVDAFFIVSGFLIFMSYERSSSIKSYAIKRIQRIYPAYIAVIFISSIILFLLSSQTLSNYFSIEWLKYLIYNGLFLNFVHSWLPGVFEQNFLQAVNGALWTIKIEVMFYISVPIIVLFVLNKNILKGLIGIYILSIIYSLILFYQADGDKNSIYILLQRQLPGQLTFFISGAFLYYFYNHFVRHVQLYILFAGIGIFISGFLSFLPFFPISLAILVIYFATQFHYLGNWGKYGDFSYAIYIWHFPVIQVFISLGVFKYSTPLAFLGVICTVTACAYLSWSFIEKPFLRKKSHYK